MASIYIPENIPNATIKIREQSEGSNVNRYVSGTLPGTIIFTSIPDGLDHTYVVDISIPNCGAVSKSFQLKEPCKGTPSVTITNDCSNNKMKVIAQLDNQTSVKIKILNGSEILFNQLIDVGAAVGFDVPEDVDLTIRVENPNYSNCFTTSTHVFNCINCTGGISAENPSSNPGGGGTPTGGNNSASINDPAAYRPSIAQIINGTYNGADYFTTKTIDKTVSPFFNTRWTNPIGKRVGQASDIQMGYGTILNFGSNNTEFYANIPKTNRFNDASQSTVFSGVGDTNLTDNTSSGFGFPYLLDDNVTKVTPTDGSNGTPNHSYYNYFKINLNNVSGQDPNYGNIRFDVEHAEADDMLYWLHCRQVWENGKYRHARNGGTDPVYKNMSDSTWYGLFLDQITRFGVLMYKKAITNMGADSTPILAMCYGVFGHKNSIIWNRIVQINGVTQQPISYWNNAISTTDRRVGTIPFRTIFAGGDVGKWFPIDRAVVPMNTGEVTGVPSRLRIMQTNSIDSENPVLRFRLEDENGNLCIFVNNEPIRITIVYKTKDGINAYEHPGGVILRSENGQKPDLTVTLTKAVDLFWWRQNSTHQNVQDAAIAQLFRESPEIKELDGRLVAGQVYPYMVSNCCEMFGTCSNFPPGMSGFGQCEAHATFSLDSAYFVGLWLARRSENIKSLLWQAADGIKDVGLTGNRVNYYGNVGSISKANTFKALDTFDKYKRFYTGSFIGIPFDVSYDNGATWLDWSAYRNDLFSPFTNSVDVRVKRAAIKVIVNTTINEVLIAGKPLFTDQINVLIRYQATPTTPQIIKPLALKTTYDDQWYFEWYNI